MSDKLLACTLCEPLLSRIQDHGSSVLTLIVNQAERSLSRATKQQKRYMNVACLSFNGSNDGVRDRAKSSTKVSVFLEHCISVTCSRVPEI